MPIRDSSSIVTAEELREMTRFDCDEVARVHLSAFEGFFLASLGPQLLGLYYTTIIDFGQMGFVCERRDRIAGFVTGVDRAFGFYRKLVTRRAVGFAKALAKSTITDPTIVLKIARRLIEKRRPQNEMAGAVSLTSIAVRPEFHGTGVAVSLMERFKSEARARGFERIALETDTQGNERVQAFYEKQGFLLSRTFTASEGRRMGEYVFEL